MNTKRGRSARALFTHLTIWVATAVFKRLFLPAPPLTLGVEKRRTFEELFTRAIASGPGSHVAYQAPYPKHEFLRYLTEHQNVLLHGSNRPDLEMLETRRQEDYKGRQMNAVFASGDGIWPLFFALIDYQHYRGSLRNGCFVIRPPDRAPRRYYFFSVNRNIPPRDLWCSGTIYILLRTPFSRTCEGTICFDEWASPREVYPLARLAVKPSDFPFIHQVARHSEQESIYTSWLRYKRRITRRPPSTAGGNAH